MNLDNWKSKATLTFIRIGEDIKQILRKIFTIENYTTITDLIDGQSSQVIQRIYFVKDVSGDPSLEFEDDEVRRHGYYQYNGVSSESIVDYTLISAPHRSMGTAFTTDLSLYLDPVTKVLRSNLSHLKESFVYEEGVQEFPLMYEPSNIFTVERNGVGMPDELVQWNIDVEAKKLTVLEPLKTGNTITIIYYYIIPIP